MNWTPSKRKRELQDFYDKVANEISTQAPLQLSLRYEDATNVLTPYVKWQYNLVTPIQGYSKVKLLSIMGYNNYTSDRLSSIGLEIDELLIKPVESAIKRGPTFVVPNQTYMTTAFTSYFSQDVGASPFFNLGSGGSIGNLTVSLYDGAGSLLTASGTPTGFFTDIQLLFTN